MDSFFEKLEKIHVKGIPDIGEALYKTIDQLAPKEKIAFKLIVECGRVNQNSLTEEYVKEFINKSVPPPPYQVAEMLGFIELPKYIRDGIDKLDSWIE